MEIEKIRNEKKTLALDFYTGVFLGADGLNRRSDFEYVKNAFISLLGNYRFSADEKRCMLSFFYPMFESRSRKVGFKCEPLVFMMELC